MLTALRNPELEESAMMPWRLSEPCGRAATALFALTVIPWAAYGQLKTNPSMGATAFALPLAADAAKCAVTKPPDPLFVPPRPYSAFHGEDEFLYGAPGLWTIVDPKHWHVHSGGKLPFFRQGFDWRKEGRPRLTVVARRLDGEGPLVWNALVGSGSQEGKGVEGMFMVTGIDVPSSGCWEITARYAAAEPDIQTLSYTVWVSN
jgi:hypothetical protein